MAGALSARLPRVYFAAAYLSLTAAFLYAFVQAERVTSSFVHHDTLVVVHLVTLGWLTCSILGATYLVLPMILQAPMPTGPADAITCALVLVSASGVVSHFWLDGYSGVAWSGILLVPVFAWMAVRVWRALAQSRAPAVIRGHVASAYGDLVLAAVLGASVALDREHAFLRAGHQAAVHAHAHLAMGGFVATMFTGIAYRMLPMLLPAAPPTGAGPWLSLALMQAGVLGFTGARLTYPPTSLPFGILLAAGMVVFLWEVARMLGRRKPAPPAHPRPDPARLLVLCAMVQLLAVVAVGLLLLFEVLIHPGWRAAYGTLALVGVFGQAVLGVGMRLLPWHTWMRAFRDQGDLPAPPHAMPVRFLEWTAALCWVPGAPTLAVGMALGEPTCVRVACALLSVGTLAAAVSAWQVTRRARSQLHQA